MYSCGQTCFLPHVPWLVYVRVCIWGMEGVVVAGWSCPHTGPCSSWQIKMNSVLFGSGSPFIIFHFAQRASQTSAAACHVKTLYQALTAPPMHTHAHAHSTHGSYTLHLALTPSAHGPTYVGSICSDLSHYHHRSAQLFAHCVAFSSPLVLSSLIWCQIRLPIFLSFP